MEDDEDRPLEAWEICILLIIGATLAIITYGVLS